MVVFGGYGDDKFTDHVYHYVPGASEWQLIQPKGTGPTPRSNHSATAVGRNLLVAHGGGKKGRFDTFHAYDVENEWWSSVALITPTGPTGSSGSSTKGAQPVASSQLPVQRSGHTACRISDKFVAFFGGKILKEDTAESFLLDVSDMLPTQDPSGSQSRGATRHSQFHCPLWEGTFSSIMAPKPQARRFHTMCTHWQSGSGVLFGGCYGEYQCLGDTWVLQCTTKNLEAVRNHTPTGSLTSSHQPILTWTRLQPEGSPPTKRWGHAASIVGDHLIVIGGRAQTDLMDIHILTLASLSTHPLVSQTADRWSTPDVSDSPMVPPPRRRATACTYAGNGATLEVGGDSDTVTGIARLLNRTRILVFGGYDGKFRKDLVSLKISSLTMVQDELPIATEVVPAGKDAISSLLFGAPQSSASANSASNNRHSPFQKLAFPASLPAPSAPSAPQVPGLPPPPPSSSMMNKIYGESKSSATSSATTATTTTTTTTKNSATMKVQTKDQVLILSVLDVELLRRLMPVFFMMNGKDVISALPHLRQYETTHPLSLAGLPLPATPVPTVPTQSSDLSAFTHSGNPFLPPPPLRQSFLKRGVSDVPSSSHGLGMRGASLRWMDDDDVRSVMQMGYSRARVFRAVQNNGQTIDQINLNVLLDACEKETEESPEDDSIEASYLRAVEIEARHASSGGGGGGGGSGSGSSGGSSSEQRSRLDRKRRVKSTKNSHKTLRGTKNMAASSGNHSQRIVELEAQLEDMKDDLTTLLQCSISFELMKDPVVTPSGQLYERDKIEQWIHAKHSDPTTRKSLRRSQLVSVRGLKDIADKYRGRGLLECDM